MCRNGQRISVGGKNIDQIYIPKTVSIVISSNIHEYRKTGQKDKYKTLYSFFDTRCESTVLFRGMDRDRIYRSSLQMGQTLDPGRQMGQWHIHLIPAVTIATHFQKMLLGTTPLNSRGCGFCYSRYLDDHDLSRQKTGFWTYLNAASKTF